MASQRTARFAASLCLLLSVGFLSNFGMTAIAEETEVGAANRNDSANEHPPLHERIDRAVEAIAIGPLAPRCRDADFIRRVSLDLTGVIPTAQQVKDFLEDEASDKRAKLIDSLLESPAFIRHIALQLNVMLLERQSDSYVDQKSWEAYLIESVAQNKPLDQVFQELIDPGRLKSDLSPARKFLLNRDAEPHAMTRDVGRIVFGVDLQCAQCHDHPLIVDYYQADYYGLYAFLNRTRLFKDPGDKATKLSELADGETSFESVFTGDGQAVTRPRLPKGATIYKEPTFAEDEAYRVKPDKKHAGKPAYSRRNALAESLTNSRYFRRNLANRLWAMVMGRGLVHPFDYHYMGNPPTNPELLSLLADDIAENDFNLRYALRQLTLTRTYQRSCEPPQMETINLADVRARREQLEQRLATLESEIDQRQTVRKEKEKLWKTAIDRHDEIAATLPKQKEQRSKAAAALEQAESEVAEFRKRHQQLQGRVQQFESVLAAAREATKQLDDEPVLTEATTSLEKRLAELTTAATKAANDLQGNEKSLAVAKQAVAKLDIEIKELQSRQIDPQQLTSLQKSYLAANSRYSDTHATRQQVRAQIELCQAILELPSQRSSEPAKAAATWKSIVDTWTRFGQVAALKPLSPEQLAVSTMQATGTLDRFKAAAKTAVEKAAEKKREAEKKALKQADAADQKDSQTDSISTVEVQTEMLNQLRGTINQFVAQFGGQTGDQFQATVNQALFLGNGPTVNSWLKPAVDALTKRTDEIASPEQLVDDLTLAIFSRPATTDERREIAEFLEANAEEASEKRSELVAELVWAMITSNEFRFNH